jgi:hypothetical protein
MVKKAAQDDPCKGWRDEALRARGLREEHTATMRQFADVVERWVKGEVDEATMLLAFHHVAMDHGAYAQKKTLQKAMKSSIEKVSQLAPLIFPPDRLIKQPKAQRREAAKETKTCE